MTEYTAQQLKAINSTEKNTAVLAGAGSGKTSVLVERFIRLVEKGTEPQRILAVTFTNKAAGEMTGRIRARMAELAGGGGENALFWMAQKKLLTNTSIGTIHTLCAAVLRSYPLEARVEPGFIIAEESASLLILEDAVREALRRALEKKDGNFLSLCAEYGYGTVFSGLQEMVSLFLRREKPEEGRIRAGNQRSLAELPRLKAEFLLLLAELLAGAPNFPKGSAHRAALEALDKIMPQVRVALAALPEEKEAATVLLDAVRSLARRSRDKELVKNVQELAGRIAGGWLSRKAEKLTGEWLAAYLVCRDLYEREKRQRALLTFDDLEILTHRLLLSNSRVRADWAGRFDHIMIDEFQDTNERQKELAYLLAGGRAGRLRGEKLFIVGDAKQSVYRFRGADVSVFDRVRLDIREKGGNEIQLADNFRSAKGILAVCNDLFRYLLAGGEARFEPLVAHNDDVCRPVEALFIDKDPDGDDGLAEARSLAARLSFLAREEGWAWKDMAILLRTRARLLSCTAALDEAGVPYHVLDGQGFFAVPEIADLLNILRFLVNSRQTLALVGALRSPLFALDDETLTRLAVAGEDMWEGLSGVLPKGVGGEQRELAERAAQKLQTLLRAARFLPAGRLLRLVIEELAVLPMLLCYPDGRQKYANVEKLVDLAFAFEQEEGGVLAAFIEHVDVLIALQTRVGQEKIETKDSAAVKIMTVHKAKGLQFPLVAVADCGSDFYGGREFFLYDEQEGLAIKVRGVEGGLQPTDFFARLREKGAGANEQEMRRLLYVAMTRAEKKLILSGVKRGGQRKCWLNWLLECFREDDGCFIGEEGRIYKAVLPDAVAVSGKTAVQSEPAAPLDFPYLYKRAQPLTVPAPPLLEVYSAAALSEYRHCPRRFYYKYAADMPEEETMIAGGASEPLAANITGLIVHSVLENIQNMGMNDALAAAIDRYCPDGAERAAVRESITGWLTAYLSGPLYKSAANRQWRAEESFRLPLLENGQGGKIWFAGSIDRVLFNEDASLSLVDFKTDRLLENKTGAYEHQLMLYALAAEHLYPGRSVRDAKLHFVRLNKETDIAVIEEKDRLLSEIAGLCAEIGNGREENEFTANTGWCRFCGYGHFCPAAV